MGIAAAFPTAVVGAVSGTYEHKSVLNLHKSNSILAGKATAAATSARRMVFLKSMVNEVFGFESDSSEEFVDETPSAPMKLRVT